MTLEIINPLEGIVSNLPDIGLRRGGSRYYFEIMDIGRRRFLVEGPVTKKEAIRRLRKRIKARRPARIYHYGYASNGGYSDKSKPVRMKMPDNQFDWEIKDDLTAMVDPYRLTPLKKLDLPVCDKCKSTKVHKIYDPSQMEDVYECKKCFNIMLIPEDTHDYTREGKCKYCSIMRRDVKAKSKAHMDGNNKVAGDKSLLECPGSLNEEDY